MSVNIIAAISTENQIGNKNQLLFRLPNDLRRFRELTQNSIVVMGRNTFESIGKPLPNRINITLSRNKKYKAPVGTFVYNDLAEVIQKYHNHNNDEDDLWIIGGEKVYYQAIPYADKIHLTIIDAVAEQADSYFPRLNLDEWKVTTHEECKADDKHPHDYHFVVYERKSD